MGEYLVIKIILRPDRYRQVFSKMQTLFSKLYNGILISDQRLVISNLFIIFIVFNLNRTIPSNLLT